MNIYPLNNAHKYIAPSHILQRTLLLELQKQIMSESIEEPNKNPFTTNEQTFPQQNEQTSLKRTNSIKTLFHNNIFLNGLRILQSLSVLITLILASLSIRYFFKKDERMGMIVFFSSISIVYHIILLQLTGDSFIVLTDRISDQNLVLILFLMEFLQMTIWFIGSLLIVLRYPFYNCTRQGRFNRVDGCKCGQASLGFIIFNFILYLIGFIVLLSNIRRTDISKIRASKNHFLDFELKEFEGEIGQE